MYILSEPFKIKLLPGREGNCAFTPKHFCIFKNKNILLCNQYNDPNQKI